MILKEFDVINAETGEISEFAPSLEAALDIMRRLKIAPTKEEGIPHGKEAWLSSDDWYAYVGETEEKSHKRGLKKREKELSWENIGPIFKDSTWDVRTSGLPPHAMYNMMEKKFKDDEWTAILQHFDWDDDEVIDAILNPEKIMLDATSGVHESGGIQIKHGALLHNLISEAAGIPGWVEKHFAWRNAVFTRDGDLRYINDVASPETLTAMTDMGEEPPPGVNVLVVMGTNPGAKSVWMHDSELLELIDREGWYEKPPPEGADPSGFWDGKGEWFEYDSGDQYALPPESDLPPAITAGKIRIRKTDLARMIHEVTDEFQDMDAYKQGQKRGMGKEGYELNFIDWTADLINGLRALGEKYGQKRDERVGERVISLFGFYDDPVEEEHMENLPSYISFYDEWNKDKGSKASAWKEAQLTFADMFLAEGKKMRLKKSDLRKMIREAVDPITGIDDELVAALKKAHPGRDVIEDADVLEKIMNKHKPADMSVYDFLFNAMVANIIYEEHRSWFERELDPAVRSKQDAMKAAANVLRDEFKQKHGEDKWYTHMWVYDEHDDAEGVHAAKLYAHEWLQQHRKKSKGVSLPRKKWGEEPMWVVPGSKALPGTKDKPMYDVFSDETFKANRAMDSSGKAVDAWAYRKQKVEEKYQEMQGKTTSEGRVIRVRKGDLQKAVSTLFDD